MNASIGEMDKDSSPKTSSASKRILQIAIALLLVSLTVVGLATWAFFTKIKPATEPLARLKSAIETVTQKSIKQSGHTLELRTDDIMELGTVEREMQSIIKYEASLLGIKKTLILKGEFKAKAGFDLSKSKEFSMQGGEVKGLPENAEILSVEMEDFEIFFSNDTLYKLTPADQEKATKQLLEQARKDAQESDLREVAERQFEQRIEDLMSIPTL